MKTKDPEEILINDEVLVCKHCEFDRFYSCKFNSNTAGLNFPGMDWMSKTVEIFVCSRCGFLHWFATEMPAITIPSGIPEEKVLPEKDPEGLSDPTECMSCGKEIPAGLDHCPSCGWTYEEPLKDE